MTKNEQIKQTLKETHERRKTQIIKVFELKVNCHHTSKETFKKLNEMFRQAKWMATKLNVQVMGGFSRLVKYAVNKFDIKEMTSYVFKSWFNGKSYELCGFKFDKECPPTYWYIVNGIKVS